MRIPTFSRQSTTDTADEPATMTAGNTAPVRTRTDTPARHERDDPTVTDGPTVPVKHRTETERAAAAAKDDRDAANRDANVAIANRKEAEREAAAADNRKPRASLLATVGLILSVVAALLVLSGPLLGYGIGVAVVALILSLSGISATGNRHVAGKTDALIGMVLSLGAIVVGVLALTGSLSWLGTDMQPVTSLRHWLDTQFVNRF